MKIKLILFLVILIQNYNCFSQNEITEDLDFERVIENLLPQQDIDVNYNDLYDRLFTLYSNPLDINLVQRSDLQSLFFLTEEQITNLLEYKMNYGNILSFFELMYIESFDLVTIQRLIPFITVNLNKRESIKSSLSQADNNWLMIRHQLTLEQKKGYTAADSIGPGRYSTRYTGDPNRLYARYLYSKSNEYSFGFTIEKDPGELFTLDNNTSRYGFDFYSFHAMIEKRWGFKKIIIGDFSMDFGQGLIFGSGIRIGKGFEPITTIRRNNLGLKPYRSVYENKNFSGISVSTSLKSLELNVFYSLVNRDAIIREDTIDERDQFITYIQTIGLHRTPTEIMAKHTLKDQSIGGNLNFKTKSNKLEIGINGIFTKYNVPILPKQKRYNQFDFFGLTNSLGGAYFNYYLKNTHIFGEFAISKKKGKAISAGIIASLSSQVQTSIHFRNYERNFHSFNGEAFGENSKISNENGIYWGLKILPLPRMVFTTYIDFYKFPWPKYQVDAPSKGRDFMSALTYSVNYNLVLRLQFRSKIKEINYQNNDIPIVSIEPKTTNKFLLDMSYLVNSKFSIKTRIQSSKVDFITGKTTGFIIAQDINYTQNKISLSARFALFDADNFDSRQYIYERDLLYVYSIPFFFNRGARYFVLLRYNASRKISFWTKFAQTKYFGETSIGSGLEEIKGDTKTNISFQMRLKF